MNAKQIAHIMVTLVESYSRGELTPDEFGGLVHALGDDAESRGIGDDVKAAYRELTWKKRLGRLHDYEAPANG